jgi:hypothetical protein
MHVSIRQRPTTLSSSNRLEQAARHCLDRLQGASSDGSRNLIPSTLCHEAHIQTDESGSGSKPALETAAACSQVVVSESLAGLGNWLKLVLSAVINKNACCTTTPKKTQRNKKQVAPHALPNSPSLAGRPSERISSNGSLHSGCRHLRAPEAIVSSRCAAAHGITAGVCLFSIPMTFDRGTICDGVDI